MKEFQMKYLAFLSKLIKINMHILLLVSILFQSSNALAQNGFAARIMIKDNLAWSSVALYNVNESLILSDCSYRMTDLQFWGKRILAFNMVGNPNSSSIETVGVNEEAYLASGTKIVAMRATETPNTYQYIVVGTAN